MNTQDRRQEPALRRSAITERRRAPALQEKDPGVYLQPKSRITGAQAPSSHATLGPPDVRGLRSSSRPHRRPRHEETPHRDRAPLSSCARLHIDEPCLWRLQGWLLTCSQLGPAHPRRRASPGGHLPDRGAQAPPQPARLTTNEQHGLARTGWWTESGAIRRGPREPLIPTGTSPSETAQRVARTRRALGTDERLPLVGAKSMIEQQRHPLLSPGAERSPPPSSSTLRESQIFSASPGTKALSLMCRYKLDALGPMRARQPGRQE